MSFCSKFINNSCYYISIFGAINWVFTSYNHNIVFMLTNNIDDTYILNKVCYHIIGLSGVFVFIFNLCCIQQNISN